MLSATTLRPRSRRLLAVGLATVLAAAPASLALAPSAARASAFQFAIMQDDDQLINGGPKRADTTLAAMKTLGVDFVRVTMLWSVVAENARTGANAHRFRADNPATYPHRNWDRFDNLVLNAARLGLGVYFTVTGPPPPWAQKKAPARYRRDQNAWMPNPGDFYNFVKAVGLRYSGRYRKEGTQTLLPAVKLWGLWNEPNQGGWLLPQSLYSPVAHHVIPMSPVLYRQLYFSGHKALVESGHAGDAILIGETAPLGGGAVTDRHPLTPKAFIRELLCVDPQGNPYTGVEAAARDCSIFNRLGPLQATGWAHHPYTKTVSPTVAPANTDWINIANLGDLPKMLDALAMKTGHLTAGLPVVSSEFGYETNPPDRFNGVPLDTQAEWMNIGDLLSFQNSRIVSTAQLQLRDAPPDRSYRSGTRRYWRTYQAGLQFANGRFKPSLVAYAMPLVAYSAGNVDSATGQRVVSVWGQLRFRGTSQAPDQVYIEYRPAGAPPTAYSTLANLPVTDVRGFFSGTIDVPGPGVIRAHWRGSDAPRDFKSRLAAVGQNGYG
jgi:hypothetical protein